MKAITFLKESRITLNLTQKELASITGFNSQKIADYETGRARVPGDLVLQIQAMLQADKRKTSKTDRS